MGLPKAPRSFLEELADYDNPAPPEFDPEQQDADQNGATGESSADEGSVDADEGREHYIDVGKSKLRGFEGIELGGQYEGASVDRDAFDREDTSSENEQDDPFAAPREEFDSNDEGSEADEEEIDEAVDDFGSDGDNDDDDGNIDGKDEIAQPFRSGTSASADSEEEGSDNEDDEDQDVFDITDEDHNLEDMDSEASSPPPDQKDTARTKDNRAALRKLMAEEKTSVAATLSAAAKAHIDKGKAIKQQRSTFDSLLNARIKLQKALIATNSMTAVGSDTSAQNTDLAAECASASRAAEEAALSLWRSLSSLRESLDTTSKKRPLPSSADSSNQSLWNEATSFETAAAAQRRNVLTKWSQRTNPSIALQPQNRFSQTPTQVPLISILDRQLSGEGMERALKRTRMARSCAPLQAAASKTPVEDEMIYDDADFYTMLLRELIDQRMDDNKTSSVALTNNIITDTLPSQKDLKVKKQVDTKASKGRKMRYTVHEKLQNFMVADDRGSWGERQRAELFSSLLGRKVEMIEDEGPDERANDVEDDDNDEANEVDGLKLFGR